MRMVKASLQLVSTTSSSEHLFENYAEAEVCSFPSFFMISTVGAFNFSFHARFTFCIVFGISFKLWLGTFVVSPGRVECSLQLYRLEQKVSIICTIAFLFVVNTSCYGWFRNDEMLAA